MSQPAPGPHADVAEPPLGNLVQDLMTPLWSAATGGCHLNRDIAAAMSRAGFDIEDVDRFAYRLVRSAPPLAYILGRARR